MGKRFEQTLYQRRCTVGKAHMKIYSVPLIIREMSIKATMQYHVTHAKMAKMKTLMLLSDD